MSSDVRPFLQGAIAAVFVSAAAAKALLRASLAPFLVATGLPATLAGLAARLMPPLEGLLGVTLLIGVFAFQTSIAATVLCFAFCAVLIRAYQRRVDKGCRCFGVLDATQLSIVPIVRSLVLTVATLALSVLLTGAKGDWPVYPLWQRSSSVLILGVMTGAGYIALCALVEQVWVFEQ